jgi:AraC-like DNA-binding protein
MRMMEHSIRPALRPFVRSVWSLNAAADEVAFAPWTILPDGCVEIVVHHADPWREKHDGAEGTQPRSFVTAQMCGPLQITPCGLSGFVAVRGTALGAYHLFGARMKELSDRTTSLAAVWHGVAELEERMQAAPDDRTRAEVFQERLLVELGMHGKYDPVVDGAVLRINERAGNISVQELAAHIGTGERRLNRRFTDRVGLSPKVFAAIIRWKSTAQLIKQEPGHDLLDVALKAGYYDHSHMLRDFRRFAGVSPSVFAEANDLFF